MNASPMRRLLVALDASVHSLAALETAVCLAARLDAELEGLFVEDEDVLRWARLPIGRAVDPASAVLRSVEPESVEAEFRAQGARAREALERAAAHARVRCRFQVVRGRVAPALLAASGAADLVVLGRCSWARSRSQGLGATARALAAGSPAAVLLMREGESLAESPVAVWHPGGEEGERAFEAALALAERDGGRIVALVPPNGPSAERLRERVERLGGVELEHRRLSRDSPTAIANAVVASGACLLVVPEEGEGVRERLEAAPCPVLLVR